MVQTARWFDRRFTFDLPHLLAAFRSARTLLVERLEAADDALIAHSALHRRLESPMRLLDHAFFVAEHDDHHLANITELVRSA